LKGSRAGPGRRWAVPGTRCVHNAGCVQTQPGGNRRCQHSAAGGRVVVRYVTGNQARGTGEVRRGGQQTRVNHAAANKTRGARVIRSSVRCIAQRATGPAIITRACVCVCAARRNHRM